MDSIWSTMSWGSLNRRPPCTTRWPTAITSTSVGPTWCSCMMLNARSRPKEWVGISSSSLYSCPPVFTVTAPCGSPTCSTRPETSGVSVAELSGSTSWNLTEDEPELRTSTYAIYFTPA